MSEVTCEFLAPPLTAEFMRVNKLQPIFGLLAVRTFEGLARTRKEKQPLLTPNRIQVAPFVTIDNEVKYALNCKLDLAERGCLQAGEYVFETFWSYGRMGMRNSDNGEMTMPTLGAFEVVFVELGKGYPAEVLHQQMHLEE